MLTKQEQYRDQISNCRYGDQALEVIKGGEILAVNGEADYQGSCQILYKTIDEDFCQYGIICWDWGSCSGCDQWEADDLTDEEIIEELNKQAAKFENLETLYKFLEHSFYRTLGEFAFPDIFKQQ